jgi:hypothetical protein
MTTNEQFILARRAAECARTEQWAAYDQARIALFASFMDEGHAYTVAYKKGYKLIDSYSQCL